jgi:hypothetical protein
MRFINTLCVVGCALMAATETPVCEGLAGHGHALLSGSEP